jgi:hypothetical protein
MAGLFSAESAVALLAVIVEGDVMRERDCVYLYKRMKECHTISLFYKRKRTSLRSRGESSRDSQNRYKNSELHFRRISSYSFVVVQWSIYLPRQQMVRESMVKNHF